MYPPMVFFFLLMFVRTLSAEIPIQEELYGEVARMEKSELHLHIGGSWPLPFLKSIACAEEMSALECVLDKLQEGVDYHEAFKVFFLIAKIVNTDEKVEQGVKALCEELYADGVVYAELRTGLKDLGSGCEGYLQAVLRGVARGTAGTCMEAPVILSLRRDTSEKIADETVDLAIKYGKRGVVGLDLSGDSTVGDGQGIMGALSRAKEAGIPITLHIGESKKESGSRQLMELMLLEPRRIGHGVHLSKEALEWIVERRIPIEMCLTSALLTGMVGNPGDHPALGLMRDGYPVCIATDDPLLFKTTLTKEIALAASLLGMGLPFFEKNQQASREWRFSEVLK